MDDDVTPIICFLLLEQTKLLSLRLQSLELNNETVYDIKPEMSWCISAIAAAAVTVTRPKYICFFSSVNIILPIRTMT